MSLPLSVSVFIAASLADLATYTTTSIQLALAFPDPVAGFTASLYKFMGVFAFTQLPLAVSEGLLTVLIFNFIRKYNDSELSDLGFSLKPEEARL